MKIEEIVDEVEELVISDDDSSEPFLKEKHLDMEGKPIQKRAPKKKESPETKEKRDRVESRFRNERSSDLNEGVIEEVGEEAGEDDKATKDEKDDKAAEDDKDESEPEERFSPEEEKKLLDEAEEFKARGNKWFKKGDNDSLKRAINRYDSALRTCPVYLHKQRAIYWSNKAACYMKLGDDQKAVESCNQALGLDPDYVKALNRRAAANEKIGKWANLQSASDDYNKLVELYGKDGNHVERDKARKNGIALESRIKTAATAETQEMLGKLKDIGNSFLGKFGMSTDMFQMAPDGKGGYSMNIGGNKPQ
ncbi:TPR repeat-containing thioredoxin TTL4 [Yarrowia sp. E02]|nr:TPR repeat-containing thioredoxin TTL4 [Yarrowia sp. E02]